MIPDYGRCSGCGGELQPHVVCGLEIVECPHGCSPGTPETPDAARARTLLALVGKLWRELAVARLREMADERAADASFGPGVEKAVIACCGQALGDELATAVGEPLAARLPSLQAALHRAWRTARD